MARSLLLAFLVGAVLASKVPTAEAQCAMCKTVLTNSAEGRRMSGSFNEAILLMVVAPYLVVGSFALAAFRTRIRSRLALLLPSLRGRVPGLRSRPVPGPLRLPH